MNTIKCSGCKHYDPILNAKIKNPVHGWCAAKSVYPMTEGPGQAFPSGVRRVDSPEKPARPVIVRGTGVVTNCTQVIPKK